MEVFTLFIPSNILRIVLWYISGADDIPNGNRWFLYLPSGVLKVHNLELSSSNCSCQNPFEQSNLENIFAQAILAIASSRVVNSKCPQRIALLRFHRSKQILNFLYSLCTICIALTHYHSCLFHTVKFGFHFVKHGERDFSLCLNNMYCFVFQFYAHSPWKTTCPCK